MRQYKYTDSANDAYNLLLNWKQNPNNTDKLFETGKEGIAIYQMTNNRNKRIKIRGGKMVKEGTKVVMTRKI